MSEVSRRQLLLGSLLVLGTSASACGGEGEGGGRALTLGISAIPDQEPELLNRLYPAMAERFATATGTEVVYRPVTDYSAVVRAFQRADIHLAWMGGLTGVQARELVPGADAIVQRDVDANFHSLFIATTDSGLEPFEDVAGLSSLRGHSLTFGADTSTSGRLMPQYFLERAGVDVADLKGEPAYSGSHDATVEAVASGAFEVGAVNEQVYAAVRDAGEVDLSGVQVLWRTPGYVDYHWLVRPDIDDVYGAGTRQAIIDLLIGLDASDPEDAEVLDLFGAEKFVPAENAAYGDLEEVARAQGLME